MPATWISRPSDGRPRQGWASCVVGTEAITGHWQVRRYGAYVKAIASVTGLQMGPDFWLGATCSPPENRPCWLVVHWPTELFKSLSSLCLQTLCRMVALSTVGDRAFPVAAARVWNSLPDLVTSAPSIAVFRLRLKTHLFNISYPSPSFPCDCTVPAQWSLVALDTIIVLSSLLTYIVQCFYSSLLSNLCRAFSGADIEFDVVLMTSIHTVTTWRIAVSSILHWSEVNPISRSTVIIKVCLVCVPFEIMVPTGPHALYSKTLEPRLPTGRRAVNSSVSP